MSVDAVGIDGSLGARDEEGWQLGSDDPRPAFDGLRPARFAGVDRSIHWLGDREEAVE